MVLMPLLSRLLTLLVILTMPLFLARLTLIPIKSLSICLDRKSGSAGMPRPISYAVFCLKKKKLIFSVQNGRASTGFSFRNPGYNVSFFYPDTTDREVRGLQ